MKLTAWDRFTMTIAPKWTLERVRARVVAQQLRNYEAASSGRRTAGWARNRGDVDAVIALAGRELRMHARDLLRNNSWARRAVSVIVNNCVGWGLVPKPSGTDARANEAAAAAWRAWAGSTDCDAEGRRDWVGLLDLAMRATVADGEVLIRRRVRRLIDGYALPLQLQVLEADFIDTDKSGDGIEGGLIRNGIEFDAIGRRAAYWIFPEHPGSDAAAGKPSKRVPASEILHVFFGERPGQSRGVSWLGAAIVNLKDLDEYEDAELMRQKIAACFAAFVTDTDGTAAPLGAPDDADPALESFEPGMIAHLPPGKAVTVASPPQVVNGEFTTRNLRRIAAGLGVTYEDLTGDYSQVNYSSARMARLVHAANVRTWQTVMLAPQLCAGVWEWFRDAAILAGKLPASASKLPAEWTVPPLPMIEPDKEGLAFQRLVRVGAMTPSQMVREQGGDPAAHWAEYAADLAQLDALGIKLDSDVRAVSQAGLTQERVGGGGGGEPPPAEENEDQA